MSVTFAPLVPWPLLFGLEAVSALVLALGFLRGASGTGMRLAALTAIGLALAGPRVEDRVAESRPDVALIAVDRSPSQALEGRPARTDAALAALRARLAGFPGIDVREVRVDGGGGRGTRLFEALERELARIPEGRLAGTVAITDGQIHDAPTRPLPGPFHVLLTGAEDEFDRRLEVVKAPAYGIVGSEVAVRFRLAETGKRRGGDPVPVRIYRDGAAAGETRLRAGEEGSATFGIEHAGPMVVELVVGAEPGEISSANNRAAVTVQGVRDRLRVMLISGLPHAGERTWRNLLKSDPVVDLVHFTILRPPEKQDATPIDELALIPFPVQALFEERLRDFDLVVMDRYVIRGVLPSEYLANLAGFVRGGGALLVVGGPELAGPRGLGTTVLGDLLPAETSGRIHEGGFRPRLTDTGERHPVTELPGAGDWGHWFRRLGARVRSGSVLMDDGAGGPLLVLDEAGQGRVALLLSDQIWLWARGFEGGGPHVELIRRLAHWLMKEPELEAEALKATVDDGRLTIERRTLSDSPGRAEIVLPSGETRSADLDEAGHGRWRGGLPAPEAGLYTVSSGGRRVLVSAEPADPLEASEPAATASRLAPHVEAAGGSARWLANGMPDVRRVAPGKQAAGRGWIGLVENEAQAVTGLETRPLVPGWLLVLLALIFLLAGWWREAG